MKPTSYRNYFRGKRITVMGLGLLGRGLGDVKFLADLGADLIVTDLKTREQLAPSLKKLARTKNFHQIKFVLGEHRLVDFRDRDFILQAAGVPLDSPYIAEARRHHIPIEMDAAWFTKLALPSGVKIAGVTGTRGKTTVTTLLYEILRHHYPRVFLGGNIKGVATLPLIKKVQPGDWVVLELDSWQLQGFGEARISPQLAVFTNFLRDHQNYYHDDLGRYFADKTNIFKYQRMGDVLVVSDQLKNQSVNFQTRSGSAAGRIVEVSPAFIPRAWPLKLLGEHNRLNAALALAAARAAGVPDAVSRTVLADFPGVPGRLELVAEREGIRYYNDTTATTPDGLLAALAALEPDRGRIILLAGGADKELIYTEEFSQALRRSVKALLLFQGRASEKIISALGSVRFPVSAAASMADAWAQVKKIARRGDVVLLSPGAASFGPPPGGFKNEYDRGEQFVKWVKKYPATLANVAGQLPTGAGRIRSGSRWRNPVPRSADQFAPPIRRAH